MGRKKNPSNQYFNESVEEAIQLYNKAETDREKNRLFGIIYPAISKIAEVYYNKIKPTYIAGEALEIQMDCICYLAERLFRIKPGKGKGFSYLTVCARNFYIFHNTKGYKNIQKTMSLDYLNENWDIADDSPDRLEEIQNSDKIMQAFINYIETNRTKLLKTKKSSVVLDAIVNKLKGVEDLDNFNRRDLLNELVKNLPTKINRHYVTIILNRLTGHYVEFRKYWDNTDGKAMDFLVLNELTENQLLYCIENYQPYCAKNGIVALARKFRVEEYDLRKALSKVGLCKV